MTTIIFLKRDKSQKCLLQVSIVPDSAKNEVIGAYGSPERLKIKIKAVPEDGKANEMLITFLSDILKLKKHQFEILRGHTQKRKDLLIDESYEALLLKVNECLKTIQSK